MNKVDLGIIGLTLLTGLVILSFVTYEAYGYDYYSPNYSIWNESPTICLNDVPRDKLYDVISSVHEWDKSFNMRGTDKYDYNIALVSIGDDIMSLVDFPIICDILVMPRDLNEMIGWSGMAIGTAICEDKNNITFVCLIEIKYDHEWWYSTLTHEVGHTLGLGHKNSFEAKDFIGVVVSQDIMLGTGNQYMQINGQTLDALDFMYNGSGFDNNFIRYNPQNYTVPHEVIDEVQNRHRR